MRISVSGACLKNLVAQPKHKNKFGKFGMFVPNKEPKLVRIMVGFRFGVGLIFLFLLTSLGTYFVSLCKKKQQNLIRIRNLSPASGSSPVIATISGPGGIIQPDIRGFSNQVNAHTTVAIAETSTNQGKVSSFADPLSPPYPPVEPVKIIKGSAPPEGFRQTDSYTEIVLPPGYIDSEHYKS